MLLFYSNLTLLFVQQILQAERFQSAAHKQNARTIQNATQTTKPRENKTKKKLKTMNTFTFVKRDLLSK